MTTAVVVDVADVTGGHTTERSARVSGRRDDRPEYDRVRGIREERDAHAEAFAAQIVAVVRPFLQTEPSTWSALDLGSGYGGTARALARRLARVEAWEPMRLLHDVAEEQALATPSEHRPVHRRGGVEQLDVSDQFDLVVLDNVYEHLPDQELALSRIYRALRPGGAVYILVPNKIWPIEAHYGLPGLAWLPLRWADRYLRLTGRGTTYEDASHAPTYFALRRRLAGHGFDAHFVVPADLSATMAGAPLHYRWGVRVLRKFPIAWAVSKALLAVGVKPPQ